MSSEQGTYSPEDAQNFRAPPAHEGSTSETPRVDAEVSSGIVSPLNAPPYAHETTRAFLKNRIAAGAFDIPEEMKDTKAGDRLVRMNNIVGSYYITPFTYEDIARNGDLFHRGGQGVKQITHQRVQQIIKSRMRTIWEQSPQEVQEEFPWEKLPLKKSLSLQLRIKMSVAHGGRSVHAVKGMQEGKSPQEIWPKGISHQQKGGARRILKGWGVDVSSTYQQLAGEVRTIFMNRLLTAQTPEEIKEIMEQVTMQYYRAETKGESPTLTKLDDVIVGSGFRPHNIKNRYKFIEVLEEFGIVIGKVEKQLKTGADAGKILRYHFIRSQDAEKAMEVLRANPDLA